MKENREVTDTNVEDIEEALEKLSTGKKIKLNELLRTFKREGIENFVTTRKKYVDVILSDYKRVLKENEILKEEKEQAWEEWNNLEQGSYETELKLKEENRELKADNYELNNRITDLLENIPIRKVKDKIKEEKMPLTIVGGIRNKKILEYGISLGRMQVLQELIEEGEEK